MKHTAYSIHIMLMQQAQRLWMFAAMSIAWSTISMAQIQPVTQLCVSQDTLYWLAPANNCGPFVAFEVYGSMSASGPFLLLGSVNDETQGFFFHATAGNDTWYYYVQSIYDCGGTPPAPSDTVSNDPPDVSPISFVSVQNDDVWVSWQASASPEVIGYIVYRQTNIGVVPIDTVYGALSLLDTTAQPAVTPEVYYVNALDACGNTSIFDQPHQTVWLQVTADSCTRTIQLSWDPYEGWPEGIERQEVWMSANGAPAQLVATLPPDATQFAFENAQQGVTYCFFVEAFAKNRPFSSRSNERCIAPNVVQPQDYLLLTQIDTRPDSTLDLIWQWDIEGEIQSYSIWRATDSSLVDAQNVYSASVPAFLPPVLSWQDSAVTAGLYYYQIQTTDACGQSYRSNIGRNLYLSGQVLPAHQNLLEWTDFYIEGAHLIGYDLYRIVGGQESLLASYGPLFTNHFDLLDPSLPQQASACYYVMAHASIDLPDGSQYAIAQRSNMVCLTQPATLYLPNALTPRGYNKEFKPVIVFGNVQDYELLIFDRYGQLIFRSQDPEVGWTGITDGGRLWPAGVYTYVVHFTQPTGQRDERKGVVMLLH